MAAAAEKERGNREPIIVKYGVIRRRRGGKDLMEKKKKKLQLRI